MRCVTPAVVSVLVIVVGVCGAADGQAGTPSCPGCGPNEHDVASNTTEKQQHDAKDTEEQSTGPPEGAPKPRALSMLSEDMDSLLLPTVAPISSAMKGIVSSPSNNSSSDTTMNTITPSNTSKNATEDMKARALNFTSDSDGKGNVLSKSSGHDDSDLSDVTIDDDEEDEAFMTKILSSKAAEKNSTSHSTCVKGGLTYENGEKLEEGCDKVCTCKDGKMRCVERCASPFVRKGKKLEDPMCTLNDAEDQCCSVIVCASDIETEPLEMCSYENKTYNRGDTFHKNCSESCICEAAGKISCKPRCTPTKKTSDRCVEVPDPNDSCCKKVLCDVSLDDYNEKEEDKMKNKILTAKYINSSAISLNFEHELEDHNLPIIEVSNDKNHWSYYQLLPEGLLFVRESPKYLKLENSEDIVNIQNTELSNKEEINSTNSVDSEGCTYKAKNFTFGEEYNDECEALCACQKDGMKCLKLECPTYSGVDVLDPDCVEWETVPPNFKPSPPQCCPERVRCKNNGSCQFEGSSYKNWEQIPINVTGCEKRCYCEMGKVDCQDICPPVTAVPPANLPCPPNHATIDHIEGDDCCKNWVCTEHVSATGFGYQPAHDEIVVDALEAMDSHTVRIAFRVPALIVGLHGRVELRYTDHMDDEYDSWELKVISLPNELISGHNLEFPIGGLKPNTEYRFKVTITLRDLHNVHTSSVYKVRTLPEVMTTTLPPNLPIEPELAITDINSTWVTVMWRKFTEYELQFIDGVQLRFKEIDGKIYGATPLIHRAVTSYTLEKLKPNTKYELGISFIPFPQQKTELRAVNMLHFTTANEVDTYGFAVSLEINQVKSTSVEILWSGVPYPEDKYVYIYRVMYQSDTGKEDHSTFKLAKRDSPTKTLIMDLKPGTRYRIWLEVFLTNGKTKTSNVRDFITKPRLAASLAASTQQDKLSRDGSDAELAGKQGDYYGPLVIVAILAAIAVVSTLVLLLILVRRHGQNKASITPPQPTAATRISQSAYDNPTYKVEIQQETMGL